MHSEDNTIEKSIFYNLDIKKEIKDIYENKLKLIMSAANSKNIDKCLELSNKLLTFMNRFRNCNLEMYFDERLHNTIMELNNHRFDTSDLLKEKNEFRIAFVFKRFNDTGGAAFTHRYMLEKYISKNISFKQYVLITNDGNEKGYEHRERYKYMKENIDVEKFCFLEADESFLNKADKIQSWLYKNKVDFAVYQPSPLILYVLASRPTLLSATFSADCHVFTIGPGTGDFTYYVENDQIYKYKYNDKSFDERSTRNVLLPLPPKKYIENAEAIPRKDLNLPEDAIVSATTNLWKCCFGDGEILLEGIAILLRQHPNYYHLFLGTERSVDNLEFFLNKNPDIKDRIRFVGEYPYIYRLLKTVDFYINSFPVSGATNTEMAALAKPSIDLFSHRDLSFHNTEFLRSNECAVTSLDEFLVLANKLIGDESYRENLGEWLKNNVCRDLDKNRLAKENIYDSFYNEFIRILKNREKLPSIDVNETINYERYIAFYSAYTRIEWSYERNWEFLKFIRRQFPKKSFAWLASIDQTILNNRKEEFYELEKELDEENYNDLRINVYLALGFGHFLQFNKALDYAKKAVTQSIYDKVPLRVAARLYIKQGLLEEACELCKKIIPDRSVSSENVEELLEAIPEDKIPIYYNF